MYHFTLSYAMFGRVLNTPLISFKFSTLEIFVTIKTDQIFAINLRLNRFTIPKKVNVYLYKKISAKVKKFNPQFQQQHVPVSTSKIKSIA